MKKSLFVLGMAVAALASCTNEEVVSVPEGSAIGFNSFVNNNTKAVTGVDATGLGTNFYVIGYYGNATGSMTNPVFKNEISTTEYFWQATNYYQFAAYANGKVGTQGTADDVKLPTEDVTYTAGGDLVISDYTVNDANDLVAAISDQRQCTSATGNAKVELTFKHMLAKVCFTFTTPVGENYTLKISELKFNAKTSGKCTYNASTGATWSEGTNDDYTYDEIADLTTTANETADGTYAQTLEKFAIPQDVPASGTQISVSFKATISGGGLTERFATLTGNLSVPTDNKWKAGYVYNYTTEVTAEKIDPSLENQKIEFEVKEVSEWNTTWTTDGDDEVDLTTSTQAQP